MYIMYNICISLYLFNVRIDFYGESDEKCLKNKYNIIRPNWFYVANKCMQATNC